MLEPGTELGRYRIKRALGTGGMGAVYEAYDTILRRPVALKVLRPRDEKASPEIEARLLREARAAASLRHPNAVAVYDIGEAFGTPFIAMELAPGRSLRAALANEDTTIGEKLSWLLAIARVLEAAHENGLIHRDIKPDNVMVADDGTVKVLDFGIAKFATTADEAPAPADADDEPKSFKTREGIVFGTPRYMAPEQRQGKELDGRADQYAWGVVALEVLCGTHPKDGGMNSTLDNAAKAGLPADVAAAVKRALQIDRTRRFPSMEDIVTRLESHVTGPRPAVLSSETLPVAEGESTLVLTENGTPVNADPEATVGAHEETQTSQTSKPLASGKRPKPDVEVEHTSEALPPSASDGHPPEPTPTTNPNRTTRALALVALAFAIGTAGVYVATTKPTTGQAPVTSTSAMPDAGANAPMRLAVMPLDSAGSEPGSEYVAEGATEELIGELAREPQLRVVAHASVRQYRAAPKPLADVGRELDVGTVVTGTLRVVKGEARLTVQIVDVKTQVARASHTYTTKADDTASSLRRAGRELTSDLGIVSKNVRAEQGTTNPAARDAYRRGRHVWNQRTEEALRKAIGYFEEATRLDPTYAVAWAAIAESYLLFPIVGLTPVPKAVADAKPSLEKALALDPLLARVHSIQATILEYAWDYAAAEKEHQRALELDPNDPVAHQWYGEMLLVENKVDDAVLHMKRALEIDPLSAPLHRNYGMVLLYGRRESEAVPVLQHTLELDPGQPLTRLYLTIAAIELGKPDDGLDQLHADPAFMGPAAKPFLRVNELYAHAKAGRKDKVTKLLAEIERFELDAFMFAFVYACAGLPEKMYPAIDRAYEARVRLTPWLNVLHPFDPYRNDPRFIERLKRMGL